MREQKGFTSNPLHRYYEDQEMGAAISVFNSLSAKSVLAGEKLVATYSIST
jgi:hypothetical protein